MTLRTHRHDVGVTDATDESTAVPTPTAGHTRPRLSPVQLRTQSILGRRPGAAPVVFDPAFVAGLHEEATATLHQFAERLDGGEVFVTKHHLAAIHACEAQFAVPDHDFEWTPARAVGQVVHRGIGLLLSWRGEPAPLDLVDEAIARLAGEDKSISTFLAGLGAGDEADLRGRAGERITKFVECFPPLRREWHPITEAPAQWPVSGPILLRARADLILGKPQGDESRKVIIDLKTGRPHSAHADDLRFYALVETLVRGVPPVRVASFYLDSGEPVVETVTPVGLRSALRRMLDGVDRIIAVRHERAEPSRTPGRTCPWCPLRADCPPGQAHLELRRRHLVIDDGAAHDDGATHDADGG